MPNCFFTIIRVIFHCLNFHPTFFSFEDLKFLCFQVTVGNYSCRAVGPNKKFAKRAAAETMLEKMGLIKPLPKAGENLRFFMFFFIF